MPNISDIFTSALNVAGNAIGFGYWGATAAQALASTFGTAPGWDGTDQVIGAPSIQAQMQPGFGGPSNNIISPGYNTNVQSMGQTEQTALEQQQQSMANNPTNEDVVLPSSGPEPEDMPSITPTQAEQAAGNPENPMFNTDTDIAGNPVYTPPLQGQ